MQRIFSGMRPSGKLHLGNYLGALKQWVALQHDAAQAIYAVVDLHGITTPYEPTELPERVRDVTINYLAAGVDPSHALVIRQSRIPQHAELMWLLSSITPIGWLDRLPNYREKGEQIEASLSPRAGSYGNNLAILSYPVLMAADILLYRSTLVPVGEDQLVHIDVTNEIARKFNHLFPDRTGGETLSPVKAFMAEEQGARIMSLQDPTKKMSKTGDDGIALTDTPDAIRAKIKRAVTDSGTGITYQPTERPAIANLLTIFSMVSGTPISELETRYASSGYADFKNDLAEAIITALTPFQQKHAELTADPAQVTAILEASEEKARAIAEETMRKVRTAMGL
ncbi:MAG: tryptophan--tRNA ligase [Patescibacteria group bacterium]